MNRNSAHVLALLYYKNTMNQGVYVEVFASRVNVARFKTCKEYNIASTTLIFLEIATLLSTIVASIVTLKPLNGLCFCNTLDCF